MIFYLRRCLENTLLGLFGQFSKEEKMVFAKYSLTKKIKKIKIKNFKNSNKNNFCLLHMIQFL
jgi:hypothetical protein